MNSRYRIGTQLSDVLTKLVCGQFWYTFNQGASAINDLTIVKFNNYDSTNLTSLSAGINGTFNRIYINAGGVMNLTFSAQVGKTSGGIGSLAFWLRKNGVTVEDSAGIFTIDKQTELIQSYNVFCSVNAGDYLELAYAVTDTAITLPTLSGVSGLDGVPKSPSIILTINQVSTAT